LINTRIHRINQCIRYMSTEGGNASNSGIEGTEGVTSTEHEDRTIVEDLRSTDGIMAEAATNEIREAMASEHLRAIREHLEQDLAEEPRTKTVFVNGKFTVVEEQDLATNHVVEEMVKEHCAQITEDPPLTEPIIEQVTEEPSHVSVEVEAILEFAEDTIQFVEEPSAEDVEIEAGQSTESVNISAEEPSIFENIDFQFAEPVEELSLPVELTSEMEELLVTRSNEQVDHEVIKESVQAAEDIHFEQDTQSSDEVHPHFSQEESNLEQEGAAHFEQEEAAHFEDADNIEEGDEEFSYAAEQYQRTEDMIQRFIRVDHAGEVAANLIYAGQLAVLGRTKEAPIIQHMWDQEKVHRDKFNELIVTERVRPTAMLPVWEVAAFALGAGTALMGKEAAMACTVAVEDTIVSHYTNQIRTIIEEGKEDKYKELLDTFKKFRDEELEHHDTGIKHDAEMAPQYKLLSTVIAAGCSAAIAISEKV